MIRSPLSAFLFPVVMNRLTDEVRPESSWPVMSADDTVMCSENRGQVEESLKRWRYAPERRGMKASQIKSRVCEAKSV